MGFLRPLRFLAKALAAEDSPRRMSAGFALGMLAGLVPKSSLLSQAALILLALLNVNLAAGYAAAALFSLLSPALDPLTHRLGLSLLDAQALRPLWSSLYDAPILPWTRFNNTVVLGSFLLGLALLFPVYRAATPLFARYQERYGARIRKWKLIQLLLGAETAGRFQ